MDLQQEAEATVEPVEFTSIRSGWARWIPPVREDSELEETETRSWMFQSAEDFQQMVDDVEQREVEATVEPAELSTPSGWVKRVPPVREDSELEGTATSSSTSQSGDDFHQMMEDADLLQNVEYADLPQVVRGITARRATEPVTPTELYSRWLPPIPEDSEINETVTHNLGSPSPVSEWEVDVAAEPITFVEAHPSLTPAIVMHDDWTQLDPIAISNAFSASFPLLDPKRMGKVTGGSVVPTEPHPRSIPPTQNGIVTPNVFSRPSSCRTVDSKQVAVAAAEPITFTKPHPKSILDDWQVDETATCLPLSASFPVLQDDRQLDPIATPNGFSAFSSLLDPKRVVNIPEPVVPTKPYPRSISATPYGTVTPTVFSKSPSYSMDDSKWAVGAVDELISLIKPHAKIIPAMQEDSQLDEIATYNVFSNFSLHGAVDSKCLVETAAEPVTLIEPHLKLTPATYTQDETEITNGFYSPHGASGPERVVKFIAQPRPVDLTKPHPKLILAMWEDSQLDEIATHDEFSNSSLHGAVDSRRLVETVAEPVALSKPHPRLTPATQDETETPNRVSSPHAVDPGEQVVEVTTEPVACFDRHPTPRLILPTLKVSKLYEMAVPDMRTSIFLLGFVIVTIALTTLFQNWARTYHLICSQYL